MLLTFLILLVILGTTDRLAPSGFAGVPIGLALTLIHLISIPITNTSVNPARSTGVALWVGGAAVEQLWLFWLAPIVGALLAGWLYGRVLQSDFLSVGRLGEIQILGRPGEAIQHGKTPIIGVPEGARADPTAPVVATGLPLIGCHRLCHRRRLVIPSRKRTMGHRTLGLHPEAFGAHDNHRLIVKATGDKNPISSYRGLGRAIFLSSLN